MAPQDDSVTYWMNQAGRVPLLTETQVLRLSKIIHTQGQDSPAGRRAISKLVRHNLRLIPMVVRSLVRKGRRYRSDEQSICDYYQAGVFGLHRAACLYDFSRGYKFSTYAFMWIRQAVQRHQYAMNLPIYVPESYYNNYQKFATFEAQEKMRIESPSTYECHVAAHRVLSGINTLTFESKDGGALEASSDPAFLSNALEASDTVEDLLALSTATDDVKNLVIETCVNGKSIACIAKELGINRDTASQKIKKCLSELREQISL